MLESVLFLILTLTCTTLGQLTYKLFFREKKKWLLALTILLFLSIPFLTYMALKGLSLDVVYMSTCVTIVAVLFGSVFLLGEKLSRNQIIGTLVIILGIIIYNLPSYQ